MVIAIRSKLDIDETLNLYFFFVFRTFVLGYGTAPPERMSMIVAILACIGLGIPLILLIIGGVYLAVKRMRNC